MKGKILVAALLVTIAAGLILKLSGGNPFPPMGIGIIFIILVYALMDMPPKHKTFSYRDQLKGMLQSRGGNPPPEAPHPDEAERHKIERESA
jgi:hypothetical protein